MVPPGMMPPQGHGGAGVPPGYAPYAPPAAYPPHLMGAGAGAAAGPPGMVQHQQHQQQQVGADYHSMHHAHTLWRIGMGLVVVVLVT